MAAYDAFLAHCKTCSDNDMSEFSTLMEPVLLERWICRSIWWTSIMRKISKSKNIKWAVDLGSTLCLFMSGQNDGTVTSKAAWKEKICAASQDEYSTLFGRGQVKRLIGMDTCNIYQWTEDVPSLSRVFDMNRAAAWGPAAAAGHFARNADGTLLADPRVLNTNCRTNALLACTHLMGGSAYTVQKGEQSYLLRCGLVALSAFSKLSLVSNPETWKNTVLSSANAVYFMRIETNDCTDRQRRGTSAGHEFALLVTRKGFKVFSAFNAAIDAETKEVTGGYSLLNWLHIREPHVQNTYAGPELTALDKLSKFCNTLLEFIGTTTYTERTKELFAKLFATDYVPTVNTNKIFTLSYVHCPSRV